MSTWSFSILPDLASLEFLFEHLNRFLLLDPILKESWSTDDEDEDDVEVEDNVDNDDEVEENEL